MAPLWLTGAGTMDDTTRKQKPAAKADRKAARGPKRAKARPRRTDEGDVPPDLSVEGLEQFSITQSILAANEAKAMAVEDILRQVSKTKSGNVVEAFEAILTGASPDDVLALKALLTKHERAARGGTRSPLGRRAAATII